MTASYKKKFVISGITAGILTLLLIFLALIRTVSSSFSNFVCRYVSRPYVYVVGHINSIFPFSVFETAIVYVIALAVALIIAAVILLKQKRGLAVLHGLTVIIICILAIFNLYTLLVGFSYYRPAAPVPQSAREYASSEVTDMVRYFADDYNSLAEKMPRDGKGNVISPYSTKALSNELVKEYSRLGGDYYYSYTPRAKGVANSWVMTLNNISGITFVPLGEPNVNRDAPPSDIPQTMAHEMAHAKGVMREGEANFVAYYVLLTSDDDYLRYCGYFSVFAALLPAVNADSNIKTDYLEIRKSLSPLIMKEYANANSFWLDKSKQPGIAGFINRVTEKIGDFMNDIFLKSNGADNGNGSYGDKVNDGEISDTGTTNPDNPDEIIYEVTYSSVQKMFFAIYEERHAA